MAETLTQHAFLEQILDRSITENPDNDQLQTISNAFVEGEVSTDFAYGLYNIAISNNGNNNEQPLPQHVKIESKPITQKEKNAQAVLKISNYSFLLGNSDILGLFEYAKLTQTPEEEEALRLGLIGLKNDLITFNNYIKSNQLISLEATSKLKNEFDNAIKSKVKQIIKLKSVTTNLQFLADLDEIMKINAATSTNAVEKEKVETIPTQAKTTNAPEKVFPPNPLIKQNVDTIISLTNDFDLKNEGDTSELLVYAKGITSTNEAKRLESNLEYLRELLVDFEKFLKDNRQLNTYNKAALNQKSDRITEVIRNSSNKFERIIQTGVYSPVSVNSASNGFMDVIRMQGLQRWIESRFEVDSSRPPRLSPFDHLENAQYSIESAMRNLRKLFSPNKSRRENSKKKV
jgi:hypothetical protein